jgi:hypothetical protein
MAAACPPLRDKSPGQFFVGVFFAVPRHSQRQASEHFAPYLIEFLSCPMRQAVCDLQAPAVHIL